MSKYELNLANPLALDLDRIPNGAMSLIVRYCLPGVGFDQNNVGRNGTFAKEKNIYYAYEINDRKYKLVVDIYSQVYIVNEKGSIILTNSGHLPVQTFLRAYVVGMIAPGVRIMILDSITERDYEEIVTLALPHIQFDPSIAFEEVVHRVRRKCYPYIQDGIKFVIDELGRVFLETFTEDKILLRDNYMAIQDILSKYR